MEAGKSPVYDGNYCDDGEGLLEAGEGARRNRLALQGFVRGGRLEGI